VIVILSGRIVINLHGGGPLSFIEFMKNISSSWIFHFLQLDKHVLHAAASLSSRGTPQGILVSSHLLVDPEVRLSISRSTEAYEIRYDSINVRL
jgi:hypothetical protein